VKGARKKKCSSCDYFHALNSLEGSSGLCDYHDSRCDQGMSVCNKYKSKKYKRKKVKIDYEN